MNFIEWKAALLSSNSSTRSDAADTTPENGADEEIVELLSVALTDSVSLVRTCAAETLGNFHLESARGALRIAIAEEKDELPLSYMLCSLGMIGEPIDYDVLISGLVGEANALRIKINSAEGLVHLTLNNAVTTICEEFLKSIDQPDKVGLPSLKRIINQMNKAIAYVDGIARDRLDFVKSTSEKESLLSILESIEKRLVD